MENYLSQLNENDNRDFEKATDDTKYVLGRILEGLMQLSESKCEFQKKKPSP